MSTVSTEFRSTQTVGEIVAIMPKASEVFKQYKIDFCCGGNRKLSDAAKVNNLDEASILKKLNETYEEISNAGKSGKGYMEMSQPELIDYIEETHHVYLRRVLPEMGELTTMIMRVHGLNHKILFRVHKLFSTLKAELEEHMMKEEEILFPMIKDCANNGKVPEFDELMLLVKETEDEHEVAGNILKELRKITEDYRVPADGCGTYERTYKILEELESDLFQHIHLENNILFKI